MNNHQKSKSDRLRVFQPKDFKKIVKAFDYNVTEVAKQIGVQPPTLNKVVNGDTKRPAITTVDGFTQYVMESYYTRQVKPDIPERITMISPWHYQKEMDKRGLTIPELAPKIKKISRATLTAYVRSNWGNTGPTYLFSLWISQAIQKFPILSEEEIIAKAGFTVRMSADYYDDYNDPKLSDKPKWSFHEAQQEWIRRDQKKLAKLPRVGHLTTHQKTKD